MSKRSSKANRRAKTVEPQRSHRPGNAVRKNESWEHLTSHRAIQLQVGPGHLIARLEVVAGDTVPGEARLIIQGASLSPETVPQTTTDRWPAVALGIRYSDQLCQLGNLLLRLANEAERVGILQPLK